MIKREREELAVYEVQEEQEIVKSSLLYDVLMEETSDIVYLLVQGKLYGIVCLGDVLHHMQNGVVRITREFTKLSDFDDEEARKIFSLKNNIQKIPVTNAGGELLGDYSRWDDSENAWINWLMEQKTVWSRLKKYLQEEQYQKIYVIEPIRIKVWIKDLIMEKLLSTKIETAVIKKNEVRDLLQEQRNCLILTIDMDEYRGMKCLECIEGIDYGKSRMKLKWATISKLYEQLNQFDMRERGAHYSINSEGEQSGNLLKKLQEDGVQLLLLYNDPYYKSSYIKDFVKKNSENVRLYSVGGEAFWPVDTEAGKQFFDDLLSEKDYADGIAQNEIFLGYKMHTAGEVNYESRYYNVSNGRRKTDYQPSQFYRKVYFFGPCVIMGAYQEDKYTIESWLQKRLCEEGYYYCVENCGSYENSYKVMQKIAFQKGDAAVIWAGSNGYQGIDSIDLKMIYEQNNVPSEWCISAFGHMNHKMTKLVADAIYEKIKGYLKKGVLENDFQNVRNEKICFEVKNYNDILGNYLRSMYINKHFTKTQIASERKGCLVVDLNTVPVFTTECVEKIFLHVNELIIFVPFGVVGTKYSFREYVFWLKNIFRQESGVTIISGDKFVPYLDFFQTYYLGDSLSKEEAELETQIFSQCIARPLNICCRFVQEPEYPKMKTYHEVLKEVLPDYGIEYIELE